jgi:SAM-dependent methyltransferase
VTFQEGAAERLPFPKETFSLVVCRIAAHHFTSVPDFLREAARVLRPEGRLLIADSTVPDGDAELDRWQNHLEVLRDPSHVRNYTPSEWRGFVEAAGLTLEALDTLEGAVPLTLNDWLKKSGCSGETADTVRRLMEEAPETARRAFRIAILPKNDIAFQWARVALKAVLRYNDTKTISSRSVVG